MIIAFENSFLSFIVKNHETSLIIRKQNTVLRIQTIFKNYFKKIIKNKIYFKNIFKNIENIENKLRTFQIFKKTFAL